MQGVSRRPPPPANLVSLAYARKKQMPLTT